MPCNIDFEKDWELKYQGAESKIYFGNNRVIKHRFRKQYRHPLLDKKLTKERTKRERRMIDKIRSKSKQLADYMPKVIWSDDSTILMTEITNCETLYNYFHRTVECSNLAPLIGKCIAEMHNIGIIHGDLTTSNLMLCRRSQDEVPKSDDPEVTDETHIVVPIDFGLSTGLDAPEERAVDLYVLERALISAHFTDSSFFNLIFVTYLKLIDEKICEGTKIVERLTEVRGRGRKLEV